MTEMITLAKLAEKARNNDWTLTKEEAIDTWTLLPDSTERFNQSTGVSYQTTPLLEIKGLGVFEII